MVVDTIKPLAPKIIFFVHQHGCINSTDSALNNRSALVTSSPPHDIRTLHSPHSHLIQQFSNPGLRLALLCYEFDDKLKASRTKYAKTTEINTHTVETVRLTANQRCGINDWKEPRVKPQFLPDECRLTTVSLVWQGCAVDTKLGTCVRVSGGACHAPSADSAALKVIRMYTASRLEGIVRSYLYVLWSTSDCVDCQGACTDSEISLRRHRLPTSLVRKEEGCERYDST